MALVKSGRSRVGDRLWASRKDGAPIPVTVTGTDFLAVKENKQWLKRPPAARRSPTARR